MPVLSEEVDWPEKLSTQQVKDAVKRDQGLEIEITVGGDRALISHANISPDEVRRVRQKLSQLGVPIEAI